MNENIRKAANLYQNAAQLLETANDLLEKEGIAAIKKFPITWDRFHNNLEVEVTLLSGIEKMEYGENKVAIRPSLTGDGPIMLPAVDWIKIEVINFTQLKPWVKAMRDKGRFEL